MAWNALRVLCGVLSYLEWRRRASGACLEHFEPGVWLVRIGAYGVKKQQEGGSNGFGHVGWLLGEDHVDHLGVAGAWVLLGWRLGHAVVDAGAR
jgi:hypothetical protein